jgi:pheromone shutdown protein TraB
MTTNILSNDIIKEWGLQKLPEIKQVEMVDRIGRLLYQALLVRSLDILSETDQTEFDLLLDEDVTTPQDVLLFLRNKIPTFDQMVIEERDKLKKDLLVPTK